MSSDFLHKLIAFKVSIYGKSATQPAKSGDRLGARLRKNRDGWYVGAKISSPAKK